MAHFEAACLERVSMFSSLFRCRVSPALRASAMRPHAGSPIGGGAGRGRCWRACVARISLNFCWSPLVLQGEE